MTKPYADMTPEEREKRRKERKAEYQRQKEARLQQEQTSQGTTVAPSEEFDVSFDVESVPQPTQSLKDRILSHFQPEEEEDKKKTKTSREKEREEKSEKLISHVLPVTIASMIALYSQRLFSERFKPCAPTKDEVASIMLPVFSVIARHVEIEGKASQDAIDIGAAILASITVSIRMLMTAELIRNGATYNEPTAETSNNVSQFKREQPTNSIASFQRTGTGRGWDNQGAVDRTIRHSTDENSNVNYGAWGGNGVNGNGNSGDDSPDDREWKAKKVADLLRRDTLGRRQMGLAPRNIPETD